MWLALLQGISFATAPLLSVSPFKIFVLSSALDQGWRRALPLALSPLIADAPVIILLWVVLQQLPDWSVNILRMIGGLFYVYLAIGLIRNARKPIDSGSVVDAPRRSFWQAITAVWIGPKIYIDWSVIGVPALLAYADRSTWHAISFLIGFYALWIPGLALQIILFGQAGKFHERATTYVILAASLLLIGFAVYQFWTGAVNLFGT
ncbi:MAG: LysE family translocator [Planctomycetota bacterium]|jgi:threonine/homoserine/homoserine lactone efflux protein